MVLGITMPITQMPAAGTLSVGAVSSLQFLTYNTRLFGRTGMVQGRETGLVFEDESRAKHITATLHKLRPDVVGLTEVWDDDLRVAIQSDLADIYPYQVGSPTARGIQDVIDSLQSRWPRGTRHFFDHVEDVVNFFSRNHYSVGQNSFLQGVIKCFFKEDWMIRAIKSGLGLPHVWGAGLMLMSRYPLSKGTFFPYPVKADLERFVKKGTLKADVHPPGREGLTVMVTHAQEGESSHAMIARAKQLMQIRDLIDESKHPAVVMGDFNDERSRWMAWKLGLLDSYRTVFPNERQYPGYTYDHNNRYAAKLGVAVAPGQGKQRIDYIFSDRALFVLASQVRREEFQHPRYGHDLSDHFPVETIIAA